MEEYELWRLCASSGGRAGDMEGWWERDWMGVKLGEGALEELLVISMSGEQLGAMLGAAGKWWWWL
jgi:hypothetical protein